MLFKKIRWQWKGNGRPQGSHPTIQRVVELGATLVVARCLSLATVFFYTA